jgi:hypothetical protein
MKRAHGYPRLTGEPLFAAPQEWLHRYFVNIRQIQIYPSQRVYQEGVTATLRSIHCVEEALP